MRLMCFYRAIEFPNTHFESVRKQKTLSRHKHCNLAEKLYLDVEFCLTN
jgi:hypothetical protein